MPSKPIPGFTFLLGTAIDEQTQRYSSTFVSGGSTASGHVEVDSHVQHHLTQSLWIRTDKGKEQHYSFHDQNIPAVRPGHRVLLTFAEKIGVVRVENLNSGRWQMIAPYNARWATAVFIIVSAICILFALAVPWLISACITPLFGVFMLIAELFEGRKWRRLHVYRTSTVGLACALIASSSLLLLLPATNPHTRQIDTVPAWPKFFFIGLWVWSFLISVARRREANEHLRHREAIEADFRELNLRQAQQAFESTSARSVVG